MTPTPSQQQAIDTNSPAALLVAGAGSGKTATVIARITKLLRHGVPPQSILCLTFTRKAALEMYERLHKAVGDQCKKVWIGTFHAVSYRVLARWGESIGYQTTGGRSITVITTEEAENLMKEVINAYGYKGTKSSVMGTKSLLAHDGTEPEQPDVKRIISEYHSRLKECNAVDFDQLLIEVQRLFRTEPRALEYYQNRFDYIFVDEYQDTDKVQYNLHELLEPKHLFCVGDPDQAIYGWRGANVGIILGFENDHPGAEIIKLEECFRCGRPIVEASNRLIEHNEKRIPKTLIPTLEGIPVVVSTANPAVGLNDWDLLPDHKPDECAVIARTHKILEDVEKACQEMGLPVFRVGKKTAEIEMEPSFQFFKAMVRLRANPRDNIAFLTANLTLKADLGAIWNTANRAGCSWFEAWDNEYCEKITRPENMFVGASVLTAYLTACEFGNIHCNSAVKEYISDNWANTNIDNWLECYQLRDSQFELEKGQPDKITLITAHAAKGLEWDHVMIVGFDEGIFPSKRAIRAGDIEEERRLAYVAMTRARKTLTICSEFGLESRFLREAGLR